MYSSRQRTPGHQKTQRLPDRCPSELLAAGRTYSNLITKEINKTNGTQKRYCFCAHALYPAQAILWDKCNFTCFSANFRFEEFSWILLQAIENAVEGHMRPGVLYLGHTDLEYGTHKLRAIISWGFIQGMNQQSKIFWRWTIFTIVHYETCLFMR